MKKINGTNIASILALVKKRFFFGAIKFLLLKNTASTENFVTERETSLDKQKCFFHVLLSEIKQTLLMNCDKKSNESYKAEFFLRIRFQLFWFIVETTNYAKG